MNNQTDQDQIDQSPDVKTPFRVVDGGWSFVCEVVNRTTTDDEDNPTFHFTSRLYGWELITGAGPICEPRPYQYDRVAGPLLELTYQGACSEYVRGDAEVVAKAWLAYRKRKRNPILFYLSHLPTYFRPMSTEQKPPTYLSQVADSKFFLVVLIIVSLGLIYTGSLMLFADWDSYEDPWTARGSNRFVFIACALISAVIWLVPLLKKSYRDARKGIHKGGY